MIKYAYEFTLTDSQINEFGSISPGEMLRFFQKAACDHASENGLGFDDLIKKDLIWVVTKIRYRLEGAFASGKTYRLTTYPLPKQSLLYFRDYYIEDEDGNLIVKGSSQWCILNSVTRKLQRTDFDFEGEFYDKHAFCDSFPKFKLSGDALNDSYKIIESDLDFNKHTNNCRYADLAAESSEVLGFNEFCILFQKETRLGDEIVFLCDKTNDSEIITGGKLKTGETVFTAKFTNIN